MSAETKIIPEHHTRKDYLKWGAVATGAIVLAGFGGKMVGESEATSQLVGEGELHPGIEKKLTDAGYSVVDIQGWTAENMRAENMSAPELTLVIEEGSDPEATPSRYKWLAVAPEGIYLPREEDDTAGDLTSDLRTANTAAGRIDSKLGYASGDLSDFLEAEIASIRNTGESLFQQGHVATSYQVEIDGVTNGIAIGRSSPSEPLTIITFDATREAPLPAGISAGGFIVAKQ